jgi:hypothetical protein
MDSESLKSCCASVCTVVAAVAVPVLIYIALLCGAGSRLIEIPQERKTSAAVGCWVAAGLYVFVNCEWPYIVLDTRQHSSYPTITRLAKPWRMLE